jgi:hypothetical protein
MDSPHIPKSRPLCKLRDGQCFYFVADKDEGLVKIDAVRWRYIGERASWDGPKFMIMKADDSQSAEKLAWSGLCLVCPCD